MPPGREMRDDAPSLRRAAPRVDYRPRDGDLCGRTLACFRFDTQPSPDDARVLHVPLPLLGDALDEVWQVDGDVVHGHDGALRWSRGGGWLFAAIEVHEAAHGGPEEAAEHAYGCLSRFVADAEERHVQRIWNYLGAINRGDGDDERYKHFCTGRIRGMGEVFAQGFPAATAIGHHGDSGLLQVYLLATDRPGTRVENPRQVSAWRYPRQYGRTPPSFARATRLPDDDVLAISGTAAVVGHASAHAGDLDAQLDETARNLDALVEAGELPAGFGHNAPLKAYVRDPAHANAVRTFVTRRWPDTPVLAVHGDICRAELLVEIDGWRYR
ncbi:pteridine-dependent deoxygenase [Luteibacter sp.]|uniref:chorismate transformation enzyme, FkbO/Hyg5 family n=1 Tax=Luteibacter sp. TaxID=1886636 RepID=UPI0025C2E5DE|nr:pteridine-dependent deoxygenase [Luteibacter sp.]